MASTSVSARTSSSGELTDQTIARGLKEALTVGSGRVVDTLGAQGGFLDGAFRIPLPDKLQDAQEVAARFGLSKPFDELEVRMNRAAEAATPKARELFVGAIRQMSFSDVMSIYRGGDDAGGGAGNDDLGGGSSADRLYGEEGNDVSGRGEQLWLKITNRA